MTLPHEVSDATPRPEIHGASARWLWIAGLSAGLLILPFAVPLNGQEHSEWIRFLGRFHPVLIHLPIGMLVILPILEIAGASRSALRESAGFLLLLIVATGVVALVLGLLLAYGDGVMGTTVHRHMWGAIALLIGLLVCIAVRPGWASGQSPRIYPALLSVTLITLAWTAHQGGSLTHGSDYLTRFMPSGLKRFLPATADASDSAYAGSVYLRAIHPILDARCVACHGASKQQGGLRLDFYALLMRGGKDGAVVAPGNPEQSLLIRRITLSPSDHHFMPAEGRTPLTSDQTAAIDAWILAGASPSAASVPGIVLAVEEPPLQPVPDYSQFMNEIREMRSSDGAKLVAVSAKASDGLVLRTIDVSSKFDDAALARFRKFAPFIVDAELDRTAITDACFDTLSAFTNLRALHLEGTAVTGRSLGKLTTLRQLSYLNLSQTRVTNEMLAPLKSMPNLRHIYLFDTPAEPAPESSNSTTRSTP